MITSDKFDRASGCAVHNEPAYPNGACNCRPKCVNCINWSALNPADETAGEGKCLLPKDPGFYPFGYWPNTLRHDGCSAFTSQERQP